MPLHFYDIRVESFYVLLKKYSFLLFCNICSYEHY